MLGATVPTVGGINKAFYWADKWDCEAVQFYLTLSRTWKVNNLSNKEISDFRNAWKKSKVKEVVAHIPYLVNLVSKNPETIDKSIKRLRVEIERANILGVKFLVLHSGTFGDIERNEAISLLKTSFNDVLNNIEVGDVKILIETMAGQKNSLGSSFVEIKEILKVLDNDSLFGVCFDTAHVLESGYEIRGSCYDKVFDDFAKEISIKKIMAFHINDSKTKFNSKSDRHEHIGEGEIGLDFFKKLLNDDRFKNIPKIIETPLMGEKSEYNLDVLRSLID